MAHLSPTRSLVLPLGLLLVAGSGSSAAQTLRGTVRELEGGPLPGAQVLAVGRIVTTDSRGEFVLDQLPPGTLFLTARLIGYHPSRTEVEIPAEGPADVTIYLVPAPVLLPTVVVESRRPGLYGIVGDTAFRPVLGARVQALGKRGGEVLTDSLGRFAFPNAGNGDYLIRVSLPGYVERRVGISLNRDDGREVTVLLRPAGPRYRGTGRAELAALQSLSDRLSWTSSLYRLTRLELARYGSLPVCEIPELQWVIARQPFVVLDGLTTYPETAACSWAADEIDLIEWGADACRDPSGTAARMLGADCRLLRSRTGGRVSSRGYLVIWQNR